LPEKLPFEISVEAKVILFNVAIAFSQQMIINSLRIY